MTLLAAGTIRPSIDRRRDDPAGQRRGEGFDDEPVDELHDQAVAAVCEAGYASISMVQHKLRIGYNRSARMLEHMERERVIGPATGGSSRREVLAGATPAPI